MTRYPYLSAVPQRRPALEQPLDTLFGAVQPIAQELVDRRLNLRSGYYYFTGGAVAPSTNAGLGTGNLRVHPRYISNPVTLTRLGAEITTIGDVGSLLRLGIYADNGNLYPGALVLDAGTIAGDSATVQEITISQALNPGVYWFGAVIQSVATTQPTVRVITTAPPLEMLQIGTSAPTANQQIGGYVQLTVTGALPTTFSSTVTPNSAQQARMFFKVA